MYHRGLSKTTGHQRDNVICEAGDTKAVLKAIAILNYPLEKRWASQDSLPRGEASKKQVQRWLTGSWGLLRVISA